MTRRNVDIEQPEQLLSYLRETGRIGTDERVTIRNLAGGVSNRTVYLRRESGEAWVLKQALAKLRVEVDWFSDPARIHREALGLRWLEKLAPAGATTPLVFEDHEHHLLAMAAVTEPHENLKTLLMEGRIDASYFPGFGAMLGTIHHNAWQRRAEVAPAFDDRSFFDSLRLEPYYQYTAARVSPAAGFLTRLIDQTRATRLTLVHGDYSPKNILVHAGKLVLLDHEVIHWGDPAFDLGFAMTHLLSKAHHGREHRADFAMGTMSCWRAYRGTLGSVPWSDGLEARAVRHTLACLLARVCGRSPLEYLTDAQRERQRDTVVSMMPDPPETFSLLIHEFTAKVSE